MILNLRHLKFGTYYIFTNDTEKLESRCDKILKIIGSDKVLIDLHIFLATFLIKANKYARKTTAYIYAGVKNVCTNVIYDKNSTKYERCKQNYTTAISVTTIKSNSKIHKWKANKGVRTNYKIITIIILNTKGGKNVYIKK